MGTKGSASGTGIVQGRGMLHGIAPAALMLIAVSCATARQGSFPSDQAAHRAVDAPAEFSFTVPASGEACRNPALDPRDGARLVLVRASGGRGDYEVPAGRYGVSSREYLRLNCVTGAVIGIVPR